MTIGYQKIINLLDNTPNQLSKFKTKNCVETNEESQEMYYEENQITFKTSVFTKIIKLHLKLQC